MRKIVRAALWVAVGALWAAFMLMVFVKGEAWLMSW